MPTTSRISTDEYGAKRKYEVNDERQLWIKWRKDNTNTLAHTYTHIQIHMHMTRSEKRREKREKKQHLRISSVKNEWKKRVKGKTMASSVKFVWKLYNKMVSSNLFRIDWQVCFYRWCHKARDGIARNPSHSVLFMYWVAKLCRTFELSVCVCCDSSVMDPDGCIMIRNGVTTVYHIPATGQWPHCMHGNFIESRQGDFSFSFI